MAFENVPRIKTNRTKIDMSKTIQTTCDSGMFLPIYWHEVLPGDTWEEKLLGQVRALTAKYPVMSEAYIDTVAAWIPKRLAFTKTAEFFGENTKAPWALEDRPIMPRINPPGGGWKSGSLADYLGYPVGKDFNQGLVRDVINAYCLVWNEYERNENLQYPIEIPSDDKDIILGKNPLNTRIGYITTTAYGGDVAPACKLKDYFTEALPSPQKSAEQATFNLLGDIPVRTLAETHDGGNNSMIFKNTDGSPITQNVTPYVSKNGILGSTLGIGELGAKEMNPINLWALGKDTPAISIGQLRSAILTQHLAEAEARGGTRYFEILSNMYNVQDAQAQVLQIPEIIATKRTRINMQQVVQTGATAGQGEDIQALGEVGGLSNTQSNDFLHYTASETEFGYIMLFMIIRPKHSYSQGIRRSLLKREYTDYFNPLLEGKSEQPVYSVELYGENIQKESRIFGYQEPWAEYRFEHSVATGKMRTEVDGSLGLYWTYGDKYTEAPTLSNEWIQEDRNNIGRTQVLQNEDQFLISLYDDVQVTRNISPYGIPGVGTI